MIDNYTMLKTVNRAISLQGHLLANTKHLSSINIIQRFLFNLQKYLIYYNNNVDV